MTPSTEIAQQETSTEVDIAAVRQEALDALRSEQESEDDDHFQVPILKIAQALTKEVQDPNNPAQSGEFVNTLTGETYGNAISFIIAYRQYGRAIADRATGKYYVAFGDLIPDAWGEILGEQFVGTRFDEHPDAEEQYKARINESGGTLKWGSGPKIATTYNYTGLALVPVRDEDDQPVEGEFEYAPCRFSLSRGSTKSARKINQLYKTMLRPPKQFWSRVFDLKTELQQFNSGAAYIPMPSLGRPTTADEQELAADLALAVRAGRVSDNADGEDPDRVSEPEKPKDALGL